MDYGRAACVALIVPLAAGAARAQDEGALGLSAAYAAYRDDNVLRRPADAGTAADTYRVTSLGIDADAPYGRQRLRASLTVNAVRYDTFERFDLDGHEGHALWQWGEDETRRLKLGVSHRRALASLASVQDGVQSTVPNALTTRRAFASAEARLGAPWQLALEGSRLEQENAAAERLANDLVLDRGVASLAWVSRAENRIGLRADLARGALPNAQAVAGMPVDNAYRQRALAAFADWRPGGRTRLRAALGRVRRDYDALPQRDFEGNTGELALEWAPTGRLELEARAERAISETEDINVSFVLAERGALTAKYRLGARTELAASLETSDRRYLGEAGQVLGAAAPRTERVSAAGLRVAYRPLARLSAFATLRRETRSSDVPGAGYAVNVASLGLRFDFELRASRRTRRR